MLGTDSHTKVHGAGKASSSPKVPHPVSPHTGTNPLSSEVSDNTVPPLHDPVETDFSTQINPALVKEDPGKAILLVLAELKDIRTQMENLNRLESTTASLVEQLANNTSKVTEMAEAVSHNKADIQELDKDLGSLKNTVESHSSQLTKLQNLKKEITDSSDQTIAKMNKLIDTQRDQVDSFNSGAKTLQKDWKKEVMIEVDKKRGNISPSRIKLLEIDSIWSFWACPKMLKKPPYK